MKGKSELFSFVQINAQIKSKQLQLEERLVKQEFYYDAQDLFEPITKSVEETSNKLQEEAKATTKITEILRKHSL